MLEQVRRNASRNPGSICEIGTGTGHYFPKGNPPK